MLIVGESFLIYLKCLELLVRQSHNNKLTRDIIMESDLVHHQHNNKYENLLRTFEMLGI